MKKHKKNTAATAVLLALIFLLTLVLTGCSGVIREDHSASALPDVDPDAGLERQVNVTLYYRLAEEALLTGVLSSVSVRANERTENAIIRTLVEGVPWDTSEITSLFPAGTEVLDISLDSNILYVTLSEDFLSTAEYDEAVRTAFDNAGRETDISPENMESAAEYDAAVAAAQQALFLKRKLAVLSLANSIAGYSSNVKVQLLLSNDVTGERRLLQRQELGLAVSAAGGENLGLLSFDASVNAGPEQILTAVLQRVAAREYEAAYPLLYFGENTVSTPTAEEVRARIEAVGGLKSFVLEEMSSGTEREEESLTLPVTLLLNSAAGEDKLETELTLVKGEIIYLLDYRVLMQQLEGMP